MPEPRKRPKGRPTIRLRIPRNKVVESALTKFLEQSTLEASKKAAFKELEKLPEAERKEARQAMFRGLHAKNDHHREIVFRLTERITQLNYRIRGREIQLNEPDHPDFPKSKERQVLFATVKEAIILMRRHNAEVRKLVRSEYTDYTRGVAEKALHQAKTALVGMIEIQNHVEREYGNR